MKGIEVNLAELYNRYLEEREVRQDPQFSRLLREVREAERELEKAQERRENALQEIAWAEGFICGLSYQK